MEKKLANNQILDNTMWTICLLLILFVPQCILKILEIYYHCSSIPVAIFFIMGFLGIFILLCTVMFEIGNYFMKEGVYFLPYSENVKFEQGLVKIIFICFLGIFILPNSILFLPSKYFNLYQPYEITSITCLLLGVVYIIVFPIVLHEKSIGKPVERFNIDQESQPTNLSSVNNLALTQLPHDIEKPKHKCHRFRMEIDSKDGIFKIGGSIDDIKFISKN